MPPDALALIRRAKAEAKGERKAAAPAPSAVQEAAPLELCQLPSMPPAFASLPTGVHYLPDFVSAADEGKLLQHILSEANASRWSPGTNGRRSQNYGGKPGQPEITEALPSWLQQLTEALMSSGAWPLSDDGVCAPPNHVIINEYDPGAGLTPHTDGPLYAARVATLSLWSDVVMELHRPEPQAVRCEAPTRLARLLLRRCSLNVLDGDAYRLFHGIRAADADSVAAAIGGESFGEETVMESVVNFREASVASCGETVRRERRVSIVFVSKLPE